MERLLYLVDVDVEDRASVIAVVDALLDVVEGVTTVGWVDAYSDYRGSLPENVAQAQGLLRARGAARGSGDRGMGIEVAPGDVEGWSLLRAYGPWSIHLELELLGDGRPTATCHDCGLSITADLTEDEVARLTDRLPAGATLDRLPAPARRRSTTPQARRGHRRWGLWWGSR